MQDNLSAQVNYIVEQIDNYELIINSAFGKLPFFQPFKPVQEPMAGCVLVRKCAQFRTCLASTPHIRYKLGDYLLYDFRDRNPW